MTHDVSPLDAIDSPWLQRFRRNLRRWYERHGRELPWRNAGDPYRVWISEIMLQQTTVAAVVPYFNRFLDRFPSLESLAATDEQDVLQLWEGLGYYSRARNIHKTAQLLADSSGGCFPETVHELQQLPGIGRYTAGAIVSFAFDRPAPIVEANTLRLYCRLLGFDGNPRSAAGQRLLWDFAEKLLPRSSPGRFNQALMDLGATICTPAEPNCLTCPVRSSCRAFAEKRQEAIPRKTNRPDVTDLVEVAVAVRRSGRYLLQKIPAGRRWGGLWDFIRFPIDVNSGDEIAPPKVIAAMLAETSGLHATLGPQMTEIRHSVTRYRIRLQCFTAISRNGCVNGELTHRWVHPRDFKEYPLSVTGRQLAELLIQRT